MFLKPKIFDFFAKNQEKIGFFLKKIAQNCSISQNFLLRTRGRNEKHVKTGKIYNFARMKFMITKIAQRNFSRFPSGQIVLQLILYQIQHRATQNS